MHLHLAAESLPCFLEERLDIDKLARITHSLIWIWTKRDAVRGGACQSYLVILLEEERDNWSLCALALSLTIWVWRLDIWRLKKVYCPYWGYYWEEEGDSWWWGSFRRVVFSRSSGRRGYKVLFSEKKYGKESQIVLRQIKVDSEIWTFS